MVDRPELRLEPLSAEHLADLDELVRDPLVGRFTPLPEPVPADQAAAMLTAYSADDTREAFAAVDEDGSFVGLAVVVRIDRTAAECELGYIVGPEHRGRGAGSEMLRLLTGHAFDRLGMARVALRISCDNTASERVAERNGYVREGMLRSAYLKPGVRVDTSIWSKLATDAR